MASVALPQTTTNPIYALRSTTSTGRKRKMPTAGLLENKRYKRSSEGAGLPGPGKEMNSTSSRTIKTAKAVSSTSRRGLSLSKLDDDHQNKSSDPLRKSSTSRQTPARSPRVPSNGVMIIDGNQARVLDQQSSKTRLQEQEKRILKFAYPYIDEIVFFKNAFGFSKPTSDLVQQVWEKAVRQESESLGQQHPTHIPKASHAVGKEMSTRAAHKLRELVKMADKVILAMYGLEKEWEILKSSGHHNDQWQDQNQVKEAARKTFINRVKDLLNKDELLHPNRKIIRFGAPQIVEIIWELWLSTDSRRGQKIDNFIDQIDAPFIWLHCLLLYFALYKYHNGDFNRMPVNKGWGKDIYARQQASWEDLADGEQKAILKSIKSLLQNRRSSGGSVDSDMSLEPRSTKSLFPEIGQLSDCAGLTSNEHFSQDSASPTEGSGGNMA